MLRNNLKIALRSLSRRKLYFLINVIGLSVSMAISLILFVFVKDEWSFDNFHDKAEAIYKINQLDYVSDDYSVEKGFFSDELKNVRVNDVAFGVGGHLADVIPEVKTSTRFGSSAVFIQHEGKWLNEIWHYADSSFFDMFSFPMVESNRSKLLSSPTNIIISAKMAQKYFGAESALGQKFSMTNRLDSKGTYKNTFTDHSIYEVVAVVDLPLNSSIQFDFLFPIHSKRGFSDISADRQFIFNSGNRDATFLELNASVDVAQVKGKVNDELDNIYGESIDILRTRRKLLETNPVRSFDLVPLGDVHFDTGISGNQHLQVRSRLYSWILLSIGILIVAVVSVNCITLNLGTFGMRGKEFTMRKVLGAQKGQLIKQLYTEGAIQILLSILVAATLLQFLIPVFNQLTNANINLIQEFNDFLLFSVALCFLLSVIIGLYPLLIVGRLKITESLNGWSAYKMKPTLIKGIMGAQFAIGLFLFVLVINMKNQFKYLLNKDMGFDKEQVVMVQDLAGKSNVFKSALESDPDIRDITLTGGALFTKNMFGFFWNPPHDPDTRVNVWYHSVDENFMNTLNIELDSGRFFENSPSEALNSVLVNQTLYKLLQQSETFDNRFEKKQIIGVVKDFHAQSLLHESSPLVLHFSPSSRNTHANAYIKLNGSENMTVTIEKIEARWNEVFPDRPFNFRFMDERIEQEYAEFGRVTKIIGYSSVVALLLSGMGLFGLMSILVLNRLKEMGIRKVLGAVAFDIYLLLSRDFAIIVLIAGALVAYPAYLVIQKWLENFAYFDNQFLSLFLLGVLIVTALCLSIVSFHTIRTSKINPVRFLRDE